MPAKSPVPMMIAAGVGALVGALLTTFGFLMLGGDDDVKPVASAAPSASAPPAEPEKPKLTEAELAASGDKAALKKVEAKSEKERSVDEAVAIHSARPVAKRKEIDELVRKMGLTESFSLDKETKKKVRAFAKDREVANHMLKSLAQMKGTTGADHLYAVWTKTRGKTDSSELARELLNTKEVRKKATLALTVTLDLKEATGKEPPDCEKTKAALPKVAQSGDRRAVGTVIRLNIKTGCGKKDRDDCYACLRDTDLVREAANAASRRKSPL